MMWMVVYDYEVPGGALNLNTDGLHAEFLLKNVEERDHFADLDVDGSVISTLFYSEEGGVVNWLHEARDKYHGGRGCCQHGDEHVGCVTWTIILSNIIRQREPRPLK
jgi:hypothetical protein